MTSFCAAMFFASCLSQTPEAVYPIPPPEPVKTIAKVGTYIFPGWYRGPETTDYPYENHDQQSEWATILKGEGPKPLLGYYDDSLPEVNDWHIKWALESGISWFAIDWYWNAGEKRLSRTLEKGFLNAKYNEQIEFCIHWCNHGLDWKDPLDWSPAGVEEIFRYCAENYFQRPNYMRINGRPVFMIWDIQGIFEACGGQNVFIKDALPRIEAACKAFGVAKPYLVAVHNAPDRLKDVTCADAITGYSYAWRTPRTPYNPPGKVPYENMIEALPSYWKEIREGSKVPFIVSTQSGWDNTPRTVNTGDPKGLWVLTDNNLELFERTLKDAREAMPTELPYVLIEAWNEWGEGSYIEPSESHGFGHLETIRRIFAPGAPTHEWAKPTPALMEGYRAKFGG